MSSILFIDGNFTVPQPASEPVLIAPFAGVKDYLILKQDFVQFGINAVAALSSYQFAPATLNLNYGADFTTANSYPGFFLCSESPLEDIGAGLVKWTRTYCKKPSTRYEATNLYYTFPGYNTAYVSGATTSAVTQRLATPANSNVKLQYDYFLVGTSGANLAAPDYSDELLIPVTTRQRWGYNATNGAFVVGFVDINPPQLWDAGINTFFPGGTNGTYPGGASLTSAAYLALVTAGGTFVAEDSLVSRWQGNIWQRVTKSIVAK